MTSLDVDVAVVGAGGFEQGDGLGDGAALALRVAIQDSFDEGCFDKLSTNGGARGK